MKQYLLINLILTSLTTIFLSGNALAGTSETCTCDPSTTKTTTATQSLPVFPGAEGFGTHTPAGRGGKVFEVTSLQDSGPGTLREALEDPISPKIIIFRVGGEIRIQDHLYIRYPFVTIAGQTAPGDGITITGNGFAIFSHDILIQHLRIRTGDQGNVAPENNDAIAVFKDSNQPAPYNIVLDHISASWAEDENISLITAHDSTISWSMISEGLDRGRHPKGTHSSAVIIGYDSNRISLHHNLMAHNAMRNPLISKGGTYDLRNNVIYNWKREATLINDVNSNTFVNIAGNSYIPGPSSLTNISPINMQNRTKDDQLGRNTPKFFVEDNIGPHNIKIPQGYSDLSLFRFDIDQSFVQGNTLTDQLNWARKTYFVQTPFPTDPVTTEAANTAYNNVLKNAGATQPLRDMVDNRIISEVKGRSGKVINSPSEVGYLPKLHSGTVEVDSDHDGMPDQWEKIHGLNPNDPNDGNKDSDQDGYTNIEEYLQSLM